MNYLAHALLSFNNDPIIVGNFIADHILPGETEKLPENVRRGVMIHRMIDSYTDSHPLFITSKRHFYNGFERYSGILVDIYYDYLLAKNFQLYTHVPLKIFTANIYSVLDKNRQHMTKSSLRFLDYVLANDLFFEYSKLERIELVLKQLSVRLNHGVFLNNSMPLFLENEEKLESDFVNFMSDLLEEVRKKSP